MHKLSKKISPELLNDGALAAAAGTIGGGAVSPWSIT